MQPGTSKPPSPPPPPTHPHIDTTPTYVLGGSRQGHCHVEGPVLAVQVQAALLVVEHALLVGKEQEAGQEAQDEQTHKQGPDVGGVQYRLGEG
jgi:hypothetical protein